MVPHHIEIELAALGVIPVPQDTDDEPPAKPETYVAWKPSFSGEQPPF